MVVQRGGREIMEEEKRRSKKGWNQLKRKRKVRKV
jgi:hypothetical protein